VHRRAAADCGTRAAIRAFIPQEYWSIHAMRILRATLFESEAVEIQAKIAINNQEARTPFGAVNKPSARCLGHARKSAAIRHAITTSKCNRRVQPLRYTASAPGIAQKLYKV